MTRRLAALALVVAGCVSAPKPPPATPAPPPQAATPQAAPALAAPSPAVPAPATPPAAAAPKAQAAAPSPSPAATPPAQPAAKAPPSVAAARPAVPKPVAPKPPPAASPATPVPEPAKAPAAPAPLDLKTLEEKLKETEAIGVMTKLSLKNQVDDLIDAFRAYYAGRSKASLDELRRPYEMLLMKVLSLLQDRDPALARAVHASRDQIWAILSNRDKFHSTLS
jgi:hypothetical protein